MALMELNAPHVAQISTALWGFTCPIEHLETVARAVS
jgi:hypothetical protein